MAEKKIVFASDDDIRKDAIGEVTNERDLDMRFETPQPIKGGIYDTQIFGSTKKCTCGMITHGRCPQCNVTVYDDDDYNKNYAYYQLHIPFIIRIKLNSLLDKLNRIGLELPKVRNKKLTDEEIAELPEEEQEAAMNSRPKVNRDPLANFWSLAFRVIPASYAENLDKTIEKSIAGVDNYNDLEKELPLETYELKGKDGKDYVLHIYELQPWTDINTVGPIGFQQLSWYSFQGVSLNFIDVHVNSVLPLVSPGLRKYSLREIGGKITKEIPELSLEYKRIIWADKYVQTANNDINNTNSVDRATLCFLLNDLYDKHINQADMLQTSKQATFRKNIGTRVGCSMRGNAMSYLDAKLGEIFLPRALAYHALQKQIVDKLCDDYQKEGYDALKLYIKADPLAMEAFEWIVDHSQVLMNRNPSLHRNNILQFTPRLWPDDTPAIGVNPFVCFTGDTKVRMTNGQIYTFEELTALYKEGKTKDLYVYATNADGERVASHFDDVGIRKEVTELQELDFGNGHIIRCTPNHKFRLANGDWVAAKDLTPDMELDELDFTGVNPLESSSSKDERLLGTACIKLLSNSVIKLNNPVPVYCMNVPVYHTFSTVIDETHDAVNENCASYNLDFDGDQIAVYFITDPKELAQFGTTLRAENVWFFDKDHSPTYSIKGDIVYGLYAATKDLPEKEPLREVDTWETLEKLYKDQVIEHDEVVLMLPNRKTTYAREKISKIIRKPLETLLPMGKPIDQKVADTIVAGLWNHPDRQIIMNELRDFGAEIATLVGVTNLPLADIYRGFSDKVQEVVDDPVLSDDAKLSKINSMLPKEIEKTMSELPNDNTEFLLKGSRIGKKTLEALYGPYVRLDENGKIKVGDSTVIEGTTEEEYVTLSHSQRKVLEIKASAVPRAGYNRTQLVLVSLDLLYHKEVNDDKSYAYFDEEKAQEDGYTLAKEAPPSKYPGLVPIYTTATSPENGIYMQQVSTITNRMTADKTHLGITFADSLAESFYQKELGLKYGGQLRQLTKEDIPALSDGIAEILPNNGGIKLGGYVYRLGDGIVPTEAVLKHQLVKKGDLIAINGNTVPIEKRFAAFYTIFQLQVSGKTRTSDAYYNEIGLSYAPFNGTVHYKDDKIYLDGKEIDVIRPGVTYFYPENWPVHFGDRIAGLTLDMAKLLQLCDEHYAVYIFYREMNRILPGCSVDLALVMFKVLVNAGFSVKEKMRNQEDFITRQLYGATTRGLETAIREGTDPETLETEIKLNTGNPILKLLLRSSGGSFYDEDDD